MADAFKVSGGGFPFKNDRNTLISRKLFLSFDTKVYPKGAMETLCYFCILQKNIIET